MKRGQVLSKAVNELLTGRLAPWLARVSGFLRDIRRPDGNRESGDRVSIIA
jgi:hypothetical protein